MKNKPKEKFCTTCKQTKIASLFAIRKLSPDGLSHDCLQCKRKYGAERYKLKGTQLRQQVKEYYQLNKTKRTQQIKKYRQTEAGKKYVRDNYKSMYSKYTYKWKARSKARYAIKIGTIAHLACEVCHNFLSEAHHPDYSQPLEVWWLCRKHHRMADKGELRLYD
jgi:hypothetical protein